MTSSQGESPIPDEERAGKLMAQMYIIKDVRMETLRLEKMKMSLMKRFQCLRAEQIRLNDYKNELELLEQEKLAHVEEIRQIQADMKSMKKIVQEANKYQDKTLSVAWDVFKEYSALKSDIDGQRQQLGLEEVPPVAVGEIVLDQQYFKKMRSRLYKEVAFETSVKLVEYSETAPSLDPDESCQPEAGDVPSTSSVIGALIRPIPDSDPPMKTCQSCQQSIHRNAPVCPLCKAKSKSRHSKRVKRKHDNDDS